MRRQQTPTLKPGAQYQIAQISQPPKKFSLWKTLGLFLIGLFIVMFILNYLLPSIGVGGCIGEIDVEGEIVTTAGYGAISSDEILSFLNQAELRPDVKGILIEINSPGGSAVASREIYLALKESNKPVWAHIRETGASGGYFIALGADKIISDPLAVTGSIGARATVYDMSSLLENLGVNTTVIKSGEMKDIGDIYRGMTDEEKSVLQGMISEIYKDFSDTVIRERSSNPRFSISDFNSNVADARIVTGNKAYELGLVDDLGTKQYAIRAFGNETGLGYSPSICYFRSEPGFLSSLFSSMGRGIGEAMAKNINTEAAKIEYK